MKEKTRRNLTRLGQIVVLSFFSLSLSQILIGAVKEKDCLSCHNNPNLFKLSLSQEKSSLFIDEASFDISVHRNLDCRDCHSDISKMPHKKKLSPVNCSTCHQEEADTYIQSIHGERFKVGDPDVPTCTTCHGKHNILEIENPKSTVYPSNLIEVCLKCHLDEKIEERHGLPSPQIFKAYENSVHGRAILKTGLQVAAACNDCHGTHNILPPDDPRSLSNRLNIPSVCGRCHTKIVQEYQQSIHGQAIAAMIKEAPVCTDCHGEHTISRITDPNGKVYSTNVPKTCGHCHENEGILGKFGLPAKRFTTYMGSFHGVATKFGQVRVANCSSCHGIHNIRPSEDPLSSVHPANLSRTCGNCHPGIGEKASIGRIHIEAKPESSLGKFIVRRFYYWFIGSLMVLFLLYVFFDIKKHRKMRKRERREG
ncbi:MAG: cytochrome c3 family protein [Candidatus Aminicenantia bacterium]